MPFSSFSELIQQSFTYLTESQASQLASVLQDTLVTGQDVTYGTLFLTGRVKGVGAGGEVGLWV